MGIVRRQFLHLEGSATALFAAPYVVRSRAQAPTISVSPHSPHVIGWKKPLVRIADPKGEGARACLTVYSQVARNAAEAADARARAGMTLGARR